ncbi:S24 family peptidase [Citrobacter freundii]|uniref:S24 family peptidase n=1 Tax=Citrobacter freundii TaxID=546 RepID=UPI0039907E2E
MPDTAPHRACSLPAGREVPGQGSPASAFAGRGASCIRRPAATFFVRAIGDSMRDMGLHSGDLMVVDKAEKPMQGDIVIAETNGEFTVKRLQLKPRIALLPMNPAYPTLYPEELQIFGVVTAFIHKTRSTD